MGGEPVSTLEKVTHLQPMLSLANARSEEELRAWVGRMRNHLAREGIEDPQFEYVCEPKIDGLAISLLYRDGVLGLDGPQLVQQLVVDVVGDLGVVEDVVAVAVVAQLLAQLLRPPLDLRRRAHAAARRYSTSSAAGAMSRARS